MRRTSVLTTIVLVLAGCRTSASELRDLESGDAEDRKEAIMDLGKRLKQDLAEAERTRILEGVRRALQDSSAFVRMIAIDVLGDAGDRASAARIGSALQDDNWGVRSAALEALRDLGARDQAHAVARVLREDARGDCRREAARTIGHFKAEAGVDACLNAISEKEPDPSVREAAWEALKAISGKDLPPRPEVWQKWRTERAGAAPEVPPPAGTTGSPPDDSGTAPR